MKNRDESARANALLDCADCMGIALSEQRLSGYLRLLADVPPADLVRALEAHQRDPDRGRFFPQVADIMAKLPLRAAGHPDADAAWAVALQSFDEGAAVLWTQEIAQARNGALAVWEIGDKVGARMSFKSAYQAILAEPYMPARRDDQAHSGKPRGQVPPRWELSAGHDPRQRADAVRNAQAAGLISHDRAKQLMPPEYGEADPGAVAAAGLLTGKVVDLPAASDSARRFREAVEAGLRAARASQDAALAARAQTQAEAQQAFETRRSEALAALDSIAAQKSRKDVAA